jgi:hypothetical protein
MAPITTPLIFIGIPPPKITTLELGEILSSRVKCSSRPCLVDGNVDATKPRVIHPHMGDKTASGIDHCNVVGDAQFDSLLFARGHQSASVGEI